ncbi:MAG TPA: ISNCY family transposase [Candidatus Limnocylindrales bacterium]|jgi:transposase
METRETISLDARAQRRLYVLNHILAHELTLDEAARVLAISVRQVRRLVQRHRVEGAAALVHGNRGRQPVNRLDDERRAQLAELARTTYAGFNPVHLAESLVVDEATELQVSARTIRRLLAEAGIALPRTRRPPRHRSRRDRMPRPGMLLQADGSRHDWLEGRGPRLTLVSAIDDATGILTGATFREQEDAVGYFTILCQTAAAYGLPEALYTDLHGIFIADPNRPPTLAEQLTGRRSLTQVGRALDALGIGWIGARSAQAKGRIERSNGTLQDRLVSELRRRRVTTRGEANEVLVWYVLRHNGRFAVEPADPTPAWRPWPAGLEPEAVLCFHYPRTVAGDATISWDGAALGLPRRHDGRAWSGLRVTVQERLDGSLWVDHGGEQHQLTAAPPSAPLLRARNLARVPELTTPPEPRLPIERPPSGASVVKPRADHPWRRYPSVRQR